MKPLNLKSITDGLTPSSVTVIAARPGAGKTALALSLATQYGVFEEKNVVFFSLEMIAEQVVQRISSICASGNKDIFSGKVSLEKSKFSSSATIALERSNVFVERDLMSTTQIAQHVEQKMAKCDGIDLVVVDYVGLLSWDRERYPSHDEYLATLDLNQ